MATKKQTKEADQSYDWSQYNAETGYENVSQEDLGIPFLQICQKGSPEYDEDHADHETKGIPGIKVGSIFNTVSRGLLYSPDGEPLRVIPVGTKTLFVEWQSRESGGGIVASHTDPKILTTVKRNDKNQDILPNGNLLVRTQYFFVLLPDYLDAQNNPTRAIISFTSTQLKKGRMWLNMMMARKIPGSNIPLPMFSHTYNITTVPEKNPKGSWRGWKIDAGDMIGDRNLIEVSQQATKQVNKNMQLMLPSSQTTEVDHEDEPF